MRAATLRLAWEIWRRGRNAAGAVAGLIAVCAALAHFSADKHRVLEDFQAVFWLLMVCSLFLTFGIFHYAEYNPRKNWHGFPYRLFSLPVSTGLLLTCPMLLGVISVELVYWAWAKLIFAPLGRDVSFWPAACIGTGMLCYQAIIWSLAGFRITRVIVLGLTGLVLVNLAMAPLIQEINIWGEDALIRTAKWVLTALGLIAVGGAWFSVETQRRGGGRGRGGLKLMVGRLIDALPRRSGPFAGPAAAQFWFEWRRAGILMPGCAAALLLLVFTPLSWLTRGDHDSAGLTVGFAWAMPFIFSAVIGKGFVKPDFWSTDISLPTFLAVRPLASGEIVVTKMKVAAWSVALTWFLVVAFLGCYLSLWADLTDLTKLWHSLTQNYRPILVVVGIVLGFLAGVILSWRAMIDSLWVGLSGSKPLYFGSAIFQVAALVFLVWSAVWLSQLFWTHLDQAMRHFRWIGWALVGAAAAKIALSFYTWNPITPRRTVKYMFLWWIGTACFVALVCVLDPPYASLKHLLILAAFLPVPLARLGIAPSFLQRNRHR